MHRRLCQARQPKCKRNGTTAPAPPYNVARGLLRACSPALARATAATTPQEAHARAAGRFAPLSSHPRRQPRSLSSPRFLRSKQIAEQHRTRTCPPAGGAPARAQPRAPGPPSAASLELPARMARAALGGDRPGASASAIVMKLAPWTNTVVRRSFPPPSAPLAWDCRLRRRQWRMPRRAWGPVAPLPECSRGKPHRGLSSRTGRAPRPALLGPEPSRPTPPTPVVHRSPRLPRSSAGLSPLPPRSAPNLP